MLANARKAVRLTKRDYVLLHENSKEQKFIQPQNYEDAEKLSPKNNEAAFRIAWPRGKEKKKIVTENSESQLEAEHYLARAKQMQLEEEEEVKRANKIILATKCQAIRDAQLAERERLMKELKEENDRLEKIMEDERKKGLQSQAKKRETIQIQRSKYVKTLAEQISENESKKFAEQEKQFKESQKMHELHKKLELEEEETKKKREESKIKIRKELNRMNEAIKHRHQMEMAEEKMANLRIQQYMQAKAAREAERAEKKRRAKMSQELEITRLRACQVRQQEVQAQEEAEAVERDQELVAKAWRAKELEAAKKRIKMDKELRESRAKQAEEKKRLKQIELEREANDVKILLGRLEEDKLKQEEEKIKYEQDMLGYRQSLHRQMKDKQKRIELMREQKQHDAREDMERQQARKSDLNEILQLKIKELKSHKVPEKYIQGVERQLGLA